MLKRGNNKELVIRALKTALTRSQFLDHLVIGNGSAIPIGRSGIKHVRILYVDHVELRVTYLRNASEVRHEVYHTSIAGFLAEKTAWQTTPTTK